MTKRKISAYIKLCRADRPFVSVPFAVTAMLLPNHCIPNLKIFILVIAAVYAAWFAGCVFNGITDINIDKNNPRTQTRPLASGELKIKEAVMLMIILGIIMILCTFIINWRYVFLLPFPVAICLFYSLSKRFTFLCHFILGIAEAIAPTGGWIVVNKKLSFEGFILSASVALWLIGIDLIYSSQDVEYDKGKNVHSIPLDFGIKPALVLSALCHITMIISLIILSFRMNLGIFFNIGTVVSAILLLIEHIIVSPDNLSKAGLAFDINQFISLVIMFFTILEVTA